MIPKDEEVIKFIKKKKNLVNFSMIAKHFNIQNVTVSDLVATLEHRKLITVKKLGGSKIVMVKK